MNNNDHNTWLLTWNKEKWAWDDVLNGYEESRREIQDHGFAIVKWSCGRNKRILPGDRLFWMKLGQDPRGIFASGYAISASFEGTHWDPQRRMDGQKAVRIYCKFDKILDYENTILDREKLQEISGKMRWITQTSGITIPEDVAERLEEVWKKY